MLPVSGSSPGTDGQVTVVPYPIWLFHCWSAGDWSPVDR